MDGTDMGGLQGRASTDFNAPIEYLNQPPSQVRTASEQSRSNHIWTNFIHDSSKIIVIGDPPIYGNIINHKYVNHSCHDFPVIFLVFFPFYGTPILFSGWGMTSPPSEPRLGLIP